MSDLIPMLRTLIADVDAGRPAALCTVVKAHGSTPQIPGAALLLRADFSTQGTLGGGCVEAEVCRRAFELLQQQRSGLLDFDLDRDYGWDDGLICGGNMSVAVTPVAVGPGLEAIRAALDCAEGRRPAWIPLVVERDSGRLEYRLHLEVAPALLVAGAGHVGQAVAELALRLDFHVIVFDDRADIAHPERFPAGVELVVADIAQALREYPLDAGCYVVVVTRGHRHDEQALAAVVRRPAAYIGMIGSRRKAALVLRDLAAAGVPPEQLARVHTPIGLPIGALTVPEIALSITAELVQVRRQTRPRLVEGPLS
ncbi:MAG: XdhC/CoxI family protein [Planctomycetota bacterium]